MGFLKGLFVEEIPNEEEMYETGNSYVEEENVLLDNRCDGNGIFVDVVTYGNIHENKFVDELINNFCIQ